jgi:hypothetical protein
MNHFFWNSEFIINKLQSDKGIGSYCIIQIKKIIQKNVIRTQKMYPLVEKL